jgi:hypothetical protein
MVDHFGNSVTLVGDAQLLSQFTINGLLTTIMQTNGGISVTGPGNYVFQYNLEGNEVKITISGTRFRGRRAVIIAVHDQWPGHRRFLFQLFLGEEPTSVAEFPKW